MFLLPVGLGLGAHRGGGAPDITAPTITSASSAVAPDDGQLAHALLADEAVSWAIRTAAQDAASVDYAEFDLSGSTLTWVGNGTKDYEAPDDANSDNRYVVVIRATDGSGNHGDQTLTVTVTNPVQYVTRGGQAVSTTGYRTYVTRTGEALSET